MHNDDVIWWQRPRLIAALCCALVGAALLAAGPALRLALTPPQPAAAADVGLDLLDAPADEPPANLPAADPPAEAPAELVVYVSGAVASPDVYRLPAGARVKDAVLAAGGLRDDAASEQVNLAAPLSDAEHVHIPRLGDAPPVPAPAAGAPAAQAGGLIDLNRAGPAELEDLPGIGQALAARIIAYREQQGPFRAVEDLQNVSGIGDTLLAKIGPLVMVGP